MVHVWTDQVHGERTRAFLIAPPATVTPLREAVLFPNRRASGVLVRVRAAKDGVSGQVDLGLPAGWTSSPRAQTVKLAKAGEETTVRFSVTPPRKRRRRWWCGPASAIGQQRFVLPRGRDRPPAHPAAAGAGAGARAAGAALPARAARRDRLRARLGRHGGRGPGPRRHPGGRARRRRAAHRRPAPLRRHRARHPRLQHAPGGARRARAPDELRGRGRHGGRAVQHQQPAVAARRAGRPLPARDRARPRHRRERGHGRRRPEAARCCARPTPSARPTSTAGCRSAASTSRPSGTRATSRSSAPPIRARRRSEGSTLVARHGKGRYVYTGLAFFRQLPAGVPGAYRLFANLLARP